MKSFLRAAAAVCILSIAAGAFADVTVAVGHNDNDHATAKFKFSNVPAPAAENAAATATFSLVAGRRDGNSGSLAVLHDGKMPGDQDQAQGNFFFDAGTDGGRILIDLRHVISVKQVNTYSWHSDTRAPQVYTLYGSDGAAAGFNAKPSKAINPIKAGWKLIAKVDTHPKTGDSGGQYGVSISDTTGTLGKFRYLLIDASRTEDEDDSGNTFFSEINVIDANPLSSMPPPPAPMTPPPAPIAAGLNGQHVRTVHDIQVDLQRSVNEVGELLPSPADLLDDAKRKAVAPKLVPALKQAAALIAELNTRQPTSIYYCLHENIDLLCYLDFLGDQEGAKGLATMAADDDKAVALRGNLAERRVAWWQANKDPKAQEKILASVQNMAAADTTSGSILSALQSFHDMGAANAALADDAELVIVNTMTGDQAAQIKEQRIGRLNQEHAMNHPLELAGPTVEGKAFSTTAYKGKVILIDMWATWCAPCVRELPRVKAMYAKYHDQGLEVVGISCDNDPAKLIAFTKANDMPWVEMWDKAVQRGDDSWAPLAKKYGVFSIPQMFLIDRNGVLRTVDARDNMETMIPKLLAEKVGAEPVKQ